MIQGVGNTSIYVPDWRSLSGQAGASGKADRQQVPEPASATQASRTGQGGQPLSDDEQRQVEILQKTDQQVRAHEQAHLAASGGLATGGASFSYQTGPDGKRYAVAGEVSIDASKGRTAEETLAKASTIRSAALAPADPSAQDRHVAAKATQMAAEARQELAAATMGGSRHGNPDSGAETSSPPSPGDAASGSYQQQQALQSYQHSVTAFQGLRLSGYLLQASA